MATFIPSAIIGSISGKIGGVQFAHGPSGNILRSRPRKVSHQTAPLLRVHAAAARVMNSFQTLDNDDYLAWKSMASNLTRANTLGIHHPMTALQYFLERNLPAAIAGLDLPPDPVGPFRARSVGTPVISFTAGGQYLINFPNALPQFGTAWISFSRPVRSTPTRTFKNYKSIPAFFFAGPNPADVAAEYNALLGTPAAGEVTGISVRIGAVSFRQPSPRQFFQTTFL